MQASGEGAVAPSPRNLWQRPAE